MSKASPLLDEEILQAIYRDANLSKRLLELENSCDIEDESEILARLVNTSQSKNEVLSSWVRYREGYSPAVVERIIQKFPIKGGEFLFDPMCGSGSTQVAAQKSNIPSGGTDISPYAVLVSKVKTTPLSKDDLESIRLFMATFSDVENWPLPERSTTDSLLSIYFSENNFNSLLSIKEGINSSNVIGERVKEFLLIALLAIVEDSSNRKKDGNGLATRSSKVTDVFETFQNQVHKMLLDLAVVDWHNVPSVTLRESALNIDVSVPIASQTLGATLGAIIFSPPYANSFDYYESYKLELLFGEFFRVDEMADERQKLIRSYRQMGKSDPVEHLTTVEYLIAELMVRLPEKEAKTEIRDGRSRLLPNLLRGYFSDMRLFLQNSAKVMPEGSYMAIIVDQSAYLGVLIPTDLLLAEIAVEAGLKLEKLVICRRAKTSGQQLNLQPALGLALRETAVILRR